MSRAALLRDVVGLVLAAVAAASVLAVDPPRIEPPPAALLAVAALAAWIAWQDVRDFTIPDGAVGGLALVGIVQRLVGGLAAGLQPGEVLLLVAFDAVLAGGTLWIVREAFFRRRGVDGLGFGDVKLAAAAAVLVGATAFSLALLAASLAGVAIHLSAGRAADPGRKIALGALLAPATALAFAAQAAGVLAGPAG